MKIGDLVKVSKCPDDGIRCSCFFCKGNSNCIGFILAPAELNMWHVMFDVGEWEMYENEMKIISEAVELTDEQLEGVVGGMTREKFEDWRVDMINEHASLFNSKNSI